MSCRWTYIALLVVFMLSASVLLAQAPPAGYNTLPTRWILKDTDPGGWAGSGTGGLEVDSTTGALPFDTTVTYNGLPSLRVNVAKKPFWWTAIIVPRGWATADIKDWYANGRIEFAVKGNAGGELFQLYLGDRDFERVIDGVRTDEYKTPALSITNFLPGGVTTDWQVVSVPLSTLIPAGSPFALDKFWTFELKNANTNTMKFWIADIKVVSPDRERDYPKIKVNQVGYTTGANKFALVTGWYEDMTAYNTGTAFEVRRASDNAVVHSGTLNLVTDYDVEHSGEKILSADFNALTTPGTYYISVAGLPNSYTFQIGDNAYDGLLRNVLRYYYYQRANVALVDPYAEGWPHDAWHSADFNAPLESNSRIKDNVSKGWYDAGDFGKYSSAASQSIGDLLWLYETFPSAFADNHLNIPEGGNGTPDLLDELRYNIDFVLNIQDAATGGFWARVRIHEGEDQLTGPRLINDIAANGQTLVKPTAHTGAAVAALAHAYVVFKDIDSAYAQTCLTAARNGWTYLVNTPGLVPSPGGPYQDDNDADNRLHAAAELYRATGEAQYNNYFLANYANFPDVFSTDFTGHDHWAMASMAFFAYMKSANPDPAFVSWFTAEFNEARAGVEARLLSSPWRNTLPTWGYWWGSNMPTLNTAMDLVIGSKILGTYDGSVVNTARSSLNYVLGLNSVSKSFVTGHGEGAIKEVFSQWYWSNDNKQGMAPGYMSGGVNSYNSPWMSQYNAKNHMESEADWFTNEHTIYWNSSLAFITTLAKVEASTPVTPPAAPSAPSNLAATAVSSSQIDLSWTDNASNESGFEIDQATDSAFTQNLGTSIAGPNVTTHEVSGLTAGTTYYFRVRAFNSGGYSADSNTASATTQAGSSPPPAPTGLAATAGNGQVELSWNASSGATSYNVKRSTTSGSGYSTIASPTSTSHADTGLTNGTTYYYVVSAVNSNGESANSSQVSATPQASGGCTASAAHVSSIVVSTVSAGQGSKRGQAQVTVLDNCGNPVANATVTGNFTGSITESGRSAVTNSSGVATILTSGTAKGNLSITFCVTGITHASLSYNASANVETCDSGS